MVLRLPIDFLCKGGFKVYVLLIKTVKLLKFEMLLLYWYNTRQRALVFTILPLIYGCCKPNFV